MNAFTLTTPDPKPFALDDRSPASGRRFRSAALFGVLAAALAFVAVSADSADATPAACPAIAQAWPAGDAPDSPGWPSGDASQSVDMFAENPTGAGFGWPTGDTTGAGWATADQAATCL